MNEAGRLGTGLATLLEAYQEAPGGVTLLQVPPEAIDPNPDQPRRSFTAEALEALVQSIARHGILQPLVIREGRDEGRFELVAGERRLRAATKLGLPRVPAVLCAIPDERLLEVALVENLQRESLDAIEEADAYKSLMERYGYTQEAVAERVGKSRSTVANALRLLDLPAPVRAHVTEGRLTAGHARAIAGLQDPEQQVLLSERAVQEALSVRETEAAVKRIKRPHPVRRRPQDVRRPRYLDQIEERLRRVLGTRVRLQQTGRTKGRIMIDFHSDEEFERLLEFFS